jgi:ATP-dependent DNA helicase RecG
LRLFGGFLRYETDTQKMMFELMAANGYISASQMAEKIGISKRKIMDNLTKLKAAHKLQRVGSAKAGHWEVTI